MANANYLKGRAFEYARMKYYREVMKLDVLRTAGSHGAWDLIAIDSERSLVHLIQCKVCKDLSTGKRLLKNFMNSPPYKPMEGIYQTMEVKIAGSTDVHRVVV